ncbi:hypothetical protein [Ruegeria sp. SCP11]|uniref:hypothetical protein n=1 Tax=Ruegeria sp. SCP11 TaxID=3141378 RepID=UPI00333727D9
MAELRCYEVEALWTGLSVLAHTGINTLHPPTCRKWRVFADFTGLLLEPACGHRDILHQTKHAR